MENSQKNLIPILIILIVVIFGGIYLFLNYSTPEPTVEVPTSNTYRNDKDGFAGVLPESWRGYQTTESQGDIYDVGGVRSPYIVGHFPLIKIAHPLSTKENPRQDIPVMVFTVEQWAHVGSQTSSDQWSVGAAPIPPSLLGQNSNYVFALPARYNYAFLAGYEEVQKILDSHPLTVFEPTK